MSPHVRAGLSAFLGVTLTLAGCGGGTLYSSGAATSALPRDDAYSCAQQQLKALGYKQTAHDDDGRRLVAQKNDSTYRESNVKFRRHYDQIEVQALPGASGATDFTLKASTFDEYQTERGITTVEAHATSAVKADGATLLDQCKAPPVPGT